MNKTKILTGKVSVVLCGALLGYTSYAQPSVSVGVTVPTPSVGITIHAESDFYEPLAPQGEWVVVGSYGRCWRPGHVSRDWRPYCNGNWERTDDGWYWVSDEPWAWATYHYGRWDFTDQYGWYWVPQIQWAPAWVSWHEGGGYVGWAPLQPFVSISVNGYVGFNQSRIPQRAFVFVEQRHFMEPVRPATVAVNNTTIINKTTVNIANTRIVNNTVINGGPATTVIEKASGRKVQPVPVRELRQKDEAVAAKQAAPASQKQVQTPVRTETEPAAKKAVATPASSPVEKPAVPPRAPAPLTPTGRVKDTEKAKPVPPQAEPGKTTPQPAAIQEPSVPKNVNTQREKQTPAADPAPLTPTGRVNENDKAKPIPSQAEPRAATPQPAANQEPSVPRNAKAQREKETPAPAPAESKSSVKPEPNHPAATTEPGGQKAAHVAKEEKPVNPSNKQVQQPAREKPAASEKTEPNAADKNHENKVKD